MDWRQNRICEALLPTPLERLKALEAEFPGYEFWIKRDDLTGFELSGNKVRKLEFVFWKLLQEGYRAVVTCGGINSNHCRATSFLAAKHGLKTTLFLRTGETGEPPCRIEGNALLDFIAGANLHWISAEQYRGRDALMEEFARQQQADTGQGVYVIPEGASDALGALGYAAAYLELHEQTEALDLEFSHVVHAIGSGGTTAGLWAGRDLVGSGARLTAVSVSDPASVFGERVRRIREELQSSGVAPEIGREPEILDDYVGRGYGQTTHAELKRQRSLTMLQGVVLDPTYSGKAMLGLLGEINRGRIPPGRVLFWHTGGGFSTLAYTAEWNDLWKRESGQ